MQGDDDDDYDEDDETMRISLNVSNALHLHAVGAQHTVSGGDGVFWRIAPLEMSGRVHRACAHNSQQPQWLHRGIIAVLRTIYSMANSHTHTDTTAELCMDDDLGVVTHPAAAASPPKRPVRRPPAAPYRCFWSVRRPPYRVPHSQRSPSCVCVFCYRSPTKRCVCVCVFGGVLSVSRKHARTILSAV